MTLQLLELIVCSSVQGHRQENRVTRLIFDMEGGLRRVEVTL
jgi:hypothetical protein